jgi:hypothetical protein
MPDSVCQTSHSVLGSQFPPPSTPSSSFARSRPSDFWLFEYLKRVLQGSSFDEPDESDELLSAIPEILSGVDRETLNAVFQEWMIRLQKCIDGNGEYVE